MGSLSDAICASARFARFGGTPLGCGFRSAVCVFACGGLYEFGDCGFLVDACLKNPQLHSLLQISNGCGLSEVLRGQRKWEDCVQREVLPGLNILSAGSWSKDAAAFLHTEQMEGLLQEACQSHALVLVDTPPVCDSPDALLVGRYTSGVLLVVWKNVAKCADIQQTVSRLNDACIPILGSVLVSKTRR